MDINLLTLKKADSGDIARFRTICLVILSSAVTPVFATDHFNLESGIPTTLEDIEPIDRGTAEVQGFLQYRRTPGTEANGEAQPRLALGIADKTQLELSAPFSLGEGYAGGNGNTQLTVLRKLRDAGPGAAEPGWAIEADLHLPTGAQPRGYKNRLGAGLSTLLKEQIGSQALHLSAGFDWSGSSSDDEALRPVVWSAAFGDHAPLNRWLVLVSDVAWTQAEEKGTTDIWMLESGFRAQITHKLIAALGAAAGLTRGPESPAWAATLGFQLALGRR